MFMIITVIMAPVEAMATSSKLSFSDALLSFFSEETPNASAKRKGTVNASVVAPDASKEMARNSGDVKIASTKMMTYNISHNLYGGKLETNRTIPDVMRIPIQIDTTITMLTFDMTPDVTISI